MAMRVPKDRCVSQKSGESSTFVDAFRESLKGINIDSAFMEHELLKSQTRSDKEGAEGQSRKKAGPAPGNLSDDSIDPKDLKQSISGDKAEEGKEKEVTCEVMTVKVSRVHPSERAQFSVIYPHTRPSAPALAYRGYPIDGGKSMKKHQSWKVQIAPPTLGMPPETLPAFPEVACLRLTKDAGYSLRDTMNLNTVQQSFNSGAAWLQKGSSPSCVYYYAAGCPPGEPVRLKNSVKGKSIYQAVHRGEVSMFPPSKEGSTGPHSGSQSQDCSESHRSRRSGRSTRSRGTRSSKS